MAGKIIVTRDVIRVVTPDGVKSLQKLFIDHGLEDVIKEFAEGKLSITDDLNNEIDDINFIPDADANLNVTPSDKGGL